MTRNTANCPGSTTVNTEPSLAKKAVRGGLWVFSLRITNRFLRVLRTIVLARLLAPEDFGLFGIAMLAISTLEAFTQTGFEAALIQKKDNVNQYLDTTWTVAVIRGVVLFVILVLSAPFIAKFFNSPQATTLIRVIAVSALLSGFRNIGLLFFQKELKFHKQFLYEFTSVLVNFIVALTLAFALRNAWALVWAGLAASFIQLCMSYILHPYRPRISLVTKKTQELFAFGKWVLGSGILVFLITQGDDLFVGKKLGAEALGLYQMAYLIANLPATEISRAIARVAFPVYSQLQDDLARLREAYLKALHLTAFLSIPLAAGTFVLAADFTAVVLGKNWVPMVSAIQVLILAGLIRSIAATTGPILHGIGKPQIDTTWQVIRLIVLLVLIYPLTTRWGIWGTSVAVLCSMIISTFGFCLGVIKITECGIDNFVKPFIVPLINSSVMVTVILLVKINMGITNIISLLQLVLVGVLIYLLMTKLYDRLFKYEIVDLVRRALTA